VPSESYAARNFVVQGVAATACQEKLVELFGALNNPEKAYIAFSVHAGFGLVVQTNAARETYKSVKEILEAESKLCPGLKMKVQIKFGGRLDSMKVLWND
jgi:DNA polymerase I-like protein with 3'-5' exonuclease and polymerase domains